MDRRRRGRRECLPGTPVPPVVALAAHRERTHSMGGRNAAPPRHLSDRDTSDTSERISAVTADPLPRGALEVNVEERKSMGPNDGFGKLWRKRFWIRLAGSTVTPAELVEVWKARYTEIWPPGSRLFQPPGGLEEGDVAAADLAMVGGTRLGTGIVVTDERDTSFTFTTVQGHMLAGTITISARDHDGITVAQVETTFMRASDPLYEIGMPLGGHRYENRFWKASLVALAR